MTKKLLFVCTGNTCRSPLAAALAAAALMAAGCNEWAVDSAGLAASSCSTVSIGSRDAAAELGLNLSSHAAKPLTPALLADATLVLVMTKSHKETILRDRPQLLEKVFTLTEFVGEDGDVSDPFGGSQELYRQMALQLRLLMRCVVENLRKEV